MRDFENADLWTGGGCGQSSEIIDHTNVPDDPHKWCYLVCVDGMPAKVFLTKPAALDYCVLQTPEQVCELYLVGRSWRG